MKNTSKVGKPKDFEDKIFVDDSCNCEDCHDDDCDCDDCYDECDCKDGDCDCGEHHGHVHKKNGATSKLPHVKMCVLEDGVPCTNCGACNMCDLDPTKICDNCGKCLDEYNTDDKGYISVPIDKIIMGSDEETLEDFYHMYGLDDDEED